MAVFTLIQKNRPNREITSKFILIRPNLPSANTPILLLFLSQDFNPNQDIFHQSTKSKLSGYNNFKVIYVLHCKIVQLLMLL